MILETPSLKDGSASELRCLHDTIKQQLRALKALGHEPSAAFHARAQIGCNHYV